MKCRSVLRRDRLVSAFVVLLVSAGLPTGCGAIKGDQAALPDVMADSGSSAPDAVSLPPELVDATEEPDLPPLALLTVQEVLARGSFGVGVTTLPLVDDSRPTAPNHGWGGLPHRPLPTEVWYPSPPVPLAEPTGVRDAPLAADGGPYPLVIYAHGFMTTRTDNAVLAGYLASRGFVIAAPTFPLTQFDAPGGANAGDVLNQPADVSFVIDELLARSGDADDPLCGAIDPERIGIFGVSLGALTALVTAFYGDFRDERIDVVAAAAAPACYLPDDALSGNRLPVLLIHGDMDAIVNYESSAPKAFAMAQPPKMLARLRGGTHTSFGAIAVDILTLMENPDVVGCAAMENNDTVTGDALAQLAFDLVGRDPDEVRAQCPAPCVDFADPPPPAMTATRQVELTHLVVGPWFEQFLAGDERYGRFLTEVLAVAPPDDVTIEIEPD